jgi:hypothetical protein
VIHFVVLDLAVLAIPYQEEESSCHEISSCLEGNAKLRVGIDHLSAIVDDLQRDR